MIIRIALSSALAACPTTTLGQPTAHVLVEPAIPPPTSPDQPEDPNPHPAHEDQSTIYRGLVYQNISNTAGRVTVDSGASGGSTFGAHLPSSIWPQNSFIIVDSAHALEVSGLLPVGFQLPNVNVSPNASRHMANPSTTQIRKSITRRQR